MPSLETLARQVYELQQENIAFRRRIEKLEGKTGHLPNNDFPITAAMVKELRELTGAGMHDAKWALRMAEGDFEAAKEFIRTKGLC